MLIEPQTVESGFSKRWSIEAIKLIFRSPVVWGVILLSSVLIVKIVEFNLLLLFTFGLIITFFSMDVASYIDKQKMTFNSFFNLLGSSIKKLIVYCSDYPLSVVLMLIFTVVFPLIMKDEALAYSEHISIFSSLAFLLMLAYSIQPATSFLIFAYLVKNTFNINEKVLVSSLCVKADDKNKMVVLFLSAVLNMGLLLVAFLIPEVSLFLIIFLPTFIYIAFREIFLGTKENQKQEVTEPALTPIIN